MNIKLTNTSVLNLTRAINALEVKGSPKAVYALAKTLRKCKAASEVIESARQKLLTEHFGEERDIKNGDARLPAYTKDYQVVLDTEVDLDVHPMKLVDLNMEKNDIAPSVLAEIAVLIEDFDKPEEKPAPKTP